MKQHPVALNCSDVSPRCPVEGTIYGYAPNLGISAFFVTFFSLCALAQLVAGLRWRAWFFTGVLIMGCLGEAIGYVGRIIMHGNPYSDIGFKIQISCLVFSPAFIAAGIYLTLKHIVLVFSPAHSLIPARMYTWLFITCDIISLLLQAIGGGLAGGAGRNQKLRDMGTDLMIGGIVWQVVTLIAFAGLVLDFVLRLGRQRDGVSVEGVELLQTKRFKLFIVAVAVAFTTVFLRCIYRIAEMVGGWANPIMRDESGFNIMEGFMIVLAVLSLTLFHPGYCFPQISSREQQQQQQQRSVNSEDPVSEGTVEMVGREGK